jgi:hypothetical protein
MGLGYTINNQVEALAVYMGLHLILIDNSIRIVVIGDYDLIVKGL